MRKTFTEDFKLKVALEAIKNEKTATEAIETAVNYGHFGTPSLFCTLHAGERAKFERYPKLCQN